MPGLSGLCRDALSIRKILVGPNVNDLIQRANFGVPEGTKLGELLTVLQGRGEAFFEFWNAPPRASGYRYAFL